MANKSSSRFEANLSYTDAVASLTDGSLLSVISLGCVMAFATFGNILVLLAVYRTKRLRTTAAILVVNLAIVDLSITITVVPFVMATAVTQKWILPWVICKLTGFINAFLTAGQIMALVHISINRYIAVALPHSYEAKCTKQATIFSVVLSWLYSLIWTLMPFFGWGKLGFIHGTLFCNILWSEEIAYAITVQVMCYFLPCIIGGILYLNVYRLVRLQGKKVFETATSIELTKNGSGKESTESNFNTVTASPSGAISFHNLAVSRDDITESGFTDDNRNAQVAQTCAAASRRGRRRKAMEARVTRTLLAVVIAFVFCWIPRGIANVWAIFASREDVPRALEYISTVFVFLNGAVNPVLYAAFHQDFKHAFIRILWCHKPKTKSNRNGTVTNASVS